MSARFIVDEPKRAFLAARSAWQNARFEGSAGNRRPAWDAASGGGKAVSGVSNQARAMPLRFYGRDDCRCGDMDNT